MLLHLITKTRDDIDAEAAHRSAKAAADRGRLTGVEHGQYGDFIDGIAKVLGPNPPEWAPRIILPDGTVASCLDFDEHDFDDRIDWVGNVETIALLTPDFFDVLGIRVDRSTGRYQSVPTTFT